MSQQESEFQKKSVQRVFGANIRVARKQRRMAVAQLAARTNYDRICLSRLEEGKQNIKLSTAIKLAHSLDASFPALFSCDAAIAQMDDDNPTGAYVEDEYLRVFVENFKRRLQLERHKQIFVYATTGLTELMVSRIVTERTDNPTLQTLGALAYSVNADMCSLFLRT